MIYRIAFLPSANLLSMKHCPKALPLSFPCLGEVIIIRKVTSYCTARFPVRRALPPEESLLRNSLDAWMDVVWVT